MFAILGTVLTLGGSDLDKLGSDDWETRESATDRLRMLGVFGVPALYRALDTDNPEAYRRAQRLLIPWHNLCQDARAVKVLTDWWPLSEREAAELWADHDTRARMSRLLSLRYGCEYPARQIHPSSDWESWWCDGFPWSQTWWALTTARERIGSQPPWFLR